jgi:hypothetical protein
MTEMYPRIPWELVADPLVTTGLATRSEKVNYRQVNSVVTAQARATGRTVVKCVCVCVCVYTENTELFESVRGYISDENCHN